MILSGAQGTAATKTRQAPGTAIFVHRVLIEVLAGLGRRWEAIETYERLRDTVDNAFAAEPEPQTKALYRRLLTSGKPLT